MNLAQILLSQTEDNREKTKLQNMYKADIQIFRTKKIVENEKTLEQYKYSDDKISYEYRFYYC